MRQPVLRHPLGEWVDPAWVFASLFGDDTGVFWLDSSLDVPGSVSYMGRGARTVTSDDTDVLALLRAELPAPSSTASRVGFALGWVGWLGYELRASTMGEPRSRRSRYPDAAVMFADRAIAFNHDSHSIELIALGTDWSGELADWRDATAEKIRDARPTTVVPAPSNVAAHWAYSDDEYLAMIAACQESIMAGDAYQLCLTTEASIDARPDPLSTYLRLRASSPTHHGALIRIGAVALLSASPEQFLSVSADGVVESKPIKGTRRRGHSAGADVGLRAELEDSDKERAENLMIVDLMRNDIGRVSAIGTVEVPSLLHVESYAHVHQLVSTVRGRLATGLAGMDAVEACFPAGSMTGAPKLSATRILDGLEARPRGIYSGVFGYFGTDGGIDLAMVIRSIIIDERGATLGSGGGITALSVPHDELAEVGLKAAALLRVLGVDA